MCGIAGLFDPGLRGSPAELAARATAMADRLRHRGPDDGGCWVDEASGLALGHRRLSIVDLSPEGHQPMVSAGGRYVVSYNGEIYNFAALRCELAALGCRFRGHSDTEVLLAAIERFGLAPTLDRLAGMFALALWDRAERRLHLVRDRLGKKPLYFGWSGRRFLFASELKAFFACPGFAPELDRDALVAFLRHLYVPAPWSIWRGIHKLPPGSILTLEPERESPGADLLGRIERYWSAKSVAEAGARAVTTLADAALLDRLEDLIGQAVEQRMMGDVPVGAFLSGGIDSALIVALMQRASAGPVRTFTIGFTEHFFDETAAARAVATHLGTEHHELVVGPAETLATIPTLADVYDEPLADPSVIPSLHVSRLARSAVTVCLSGDGGDELFGGYGRYLLAKRLGDRMERVPRWVRTLAARGIASVPAGAWDLALRPLGPQALPGLRGSASGDRLHKMAGVLASGDRDELYRNLLSLTDLPERWVTEGREPPFGLTDPAQRPDLADPLRRMMYFDTVTYLPDDILVKVDRASMAHGLEARAPLLDHRLLEFAWTIPPGTMRRDGRGKWPLRQLFARHLPPALADRQKQGFAVPVGDWLKGPLRDWAAELLDPRRLAADGLLDAAAIRQMWRQHQAGSRNFGSQLWALAMFRSWQERWLVPAPAQRAVA